MPRNIRIRHIISQTGEVAWQLQQLHFSEYRPPAGPWRPAVNAVRYGDRIELCVDLAGVDTQQVQLTCEGHALRLRGVRTGLRTECADAGACRVLMMEIDDGPFERVLALPRDFVLDRDRISARQENGFLWIVIPAQGESKRQGEP